MTETLDFQGAKALLLPERGGLLAELTLKDPKGRPTPVLWMPPAGVESGSGWPGGGAPLCFPFAGRVFHEGAAFRYALSGESPQVIRAMPLHGFGYGSPWKVTDRSRFHVEMTLGDNPGTHELYPFRFRVVTKYTLAATSLKWDVTVEARGPLQGAGKMPVALGIHPYFCAPLSPDSPIDRCYLKIPALEKLRVTPSGAAGKVQPFPEEGEQEARLTDPTMGNLILGHLTARRATLVDEGAKLAIETRWSDADLIRYVVLWTKPGEGFHCVEPWMGLPDAVSNGHGAKWLRAGDRLAVSFEIGLIGSKPTAENG